MDTYERKNFLDPIEEEFERVEDLKFKTEESVSDVVIKLKDMRLCSYGLKIKINCSDGYVQLSFQLFKTFDCRIHPTHEQGFLLHNL